MELPFGVVVRWDRFFYISLGYFLLGVICMPFSPTASVISFLMLLSLWSSIPGYINLHLIEVNIFEMVFVIIALRFGGFLAALLSIPYAITSSLMSVHYEPKDVIRWSLGAVITFPFIPVIHSYLGGNLLYTLYAFTIISYTIYLVATILILPGQIFESIRYLFLALPIAFLTNMLYVKVFEDPMLALFNPNMELKLIFPIIIGAILLTIGGVKILGGYLKKHEAEYTRERKTTTTGEKNSTAPII